MWDWEIRNNLKSLTWELRATKQNMDQLIESHIDSVRISFDTQSLWILNAALALIMFGIALDLTPEDFKRLLKKPKIILTGIVSQFFLLPLLTFILIYIVDPLPSFALGMFMVAACPGGNVSNFMTYLGRGNTALSVSLTAFATLAAIILTPINFQFWASLYQPTELLLQKISISPLDMVVLVAFLLGVPLILGMWVRQKRPVWAKKTTHWLKIGALVFFMLLVVLALLKNREVLVEYIGYIFILVLVHNLLAFSGGFSLSSLLGLQQADRRSVTIETGIQNSGLGLLLVFTFFDGLGGMAIIVAFWGIWHLISGLLLAGFWSTRPLKDNR